MTNELARKDADHYQVIFGKADSRNEIEKALPPGLTIKKFQQTIYLACKKNPGILDCTQKSIYLALMEAATMGLDPSISNSCFFIPRRNKGVLELSVQVGYRTIINWIMNTEEIKDINVFVVYEGEVFEIRGGTEAGITHEINPEVEKSWKTIKFVYGVATTVKGGKIWRYLDKAGIIARRSRAKTEVIWREWPIEMTLKTGLIYLSKYLPMNTELSGVLDKQEAEITGSEHLSADKVELKEVNIIGSEQEADQILEPK